MNFLSGMARQLAVVFLLSIGLAASSAQTIHMIEQWESTPGTGSTSGQGSSAGGQATPVDGSTTITCGISTTLFGGGVPPHGFTVPPFQIEIFINDNSPA